MGEAASATSGHLNLWFTWTENDRRAGLHEWMGEFLTVISD
jgi:hypothetical protein